jgi:hypothetical protein
MLSSPSLSQFYVQTFTKTLTYQNLVGEPEGKRQLGRPRRILENNIKTNLREIGLEGVDWIHMA